MSKDKAESMLGTSFPKKHVVALINHFKDSSENFQKQEWEASIAKSGKFIEAALKALHVCATAQPAPIGKAFKADQIINALNNLPKGAADDTIRVLIPRACRFVYEVASNRGGRHDPDEIDPNVMDATAAITMCSWILAEMIRFSQKGAVDLAEAQCIITGLLERKLPLIEEVDGRIYFHRPKKSATEVALVALERRYPGRIRKEELIDCVKRNGFKSSNAGVALTRIMKYVDESPEGLRLLATGRVIAAGLLAT